MTSDTRTNHNLAQFLSITVMMNRGGWHWQWQCVVLVLVLSAMECRAVQHVVGEGRGWDPLSSIRFNEWASHNIFRVGDNLWFAYSAASQSVVEVKSHEEWAACNVSNPIRLYNGGLDSVPLVSVGSRYFTSGSAEDCLKNGMKLHVNVLPSTKTVPARSQFMFMAQAPTSSATSGSLPVFFIFTCLLALTVFL